MARARARAAAAGAAAEEAARRAADCMRVAILAAAPLFG